MMPADFRSSAHLAGPSTVQGAPPVPRRVAPRGRGLPTPAGNGKRRKLSWQLKLVYLTWIVVLFDPHYYLARFGLSPLLKMPIVLILTLGVTVLMKPPKKILSPYLLAFLMVGAVTIPFAYNIGYARMMWNQVLLYYILTVATLVHVRTPYQTLPILSLFAFQFGWYGFHSGLSGRVGWHPTLGNLDGYGALVVLGLAMCYYFGMAAKERRVRLWAFAFAGICVLGVVASFARGAVLAAGLVLIYVWLRSPNKIKTGVSVGAAVIITMIAASQLFPDGSFWTEMQSAFTEGTEQGTGNQRKELWIAAVKVWKQRPVFGVGIENFGPFAAAFFEVGEVGNAYAENPGRLYGRQLHSIFFQILSELGTVGSAVFILMLVDFWRRNRKLHTKAHAQRWSEDTGGKFELRYLALGLESAMIAYLATGFFYDQLWVNWLYTLLAFNLLLFYVTEPPKGRRRPRGARRLVRT